MKNLGFSFGLGAGLPNYFYLLLVGLIFVLLVRRRLEGVGWWLIVAGGLANGLSRVMFGYVWDYFHWGPLWFNLADISITLGVVWQIWSYRYFGKTKT